MEIRVAKVRDGDELPDGAEIIETTDITTQDSVGPDQKLRVWYHVPMWDK